MTDLTAAHARARALTPGPSPQGGGESAVHWAEQYQDCIWEAGGQGPRAWDCWSFFRHVQAVHFGRQVPEVEVDASNIHAVARAFGGHDERARWQEVAAPAEGDAALLAHSRYPSHVGVWLDADGGGVLHCQNGAGVLFTQANRLAICGWGRVTFFRPLGAPSPPNPCTSPPAPPPGGEGSQ